MTTKAHELAARLRTWYSNGQNGMETVCNNENAPDEVRAAVKNWYVKGQARLDAIANEIEKLGDK